MSRKMALLALLGWIGSSSFLFKSNTMVAQIVDFSPRGGVHVRAPFVRVDVFPYGGVSVRAPFAAVDVPGRRFRYGPEPIITSEPQWYGPNMPASQQLATMRDESLWRLLQIDANRLRDELRRFDTAVRWQRYLRVPEAGLADSPASADERRVALEDAIERFGKTAADPQFAMIAQLPAFVATQMVLTELWARLGHPIKAGGGVEDLPLPPPAQPGAESPLIPVPSH